MQPRQAGDGGVCVLSVVDRRSKRSEDRRPAAFDTITLDRSQPGAIRVLSDRAGQVTAFDCDRDRVRPIVADLVGSAGAAAFLVSHNDDVVLDPVALPAAARIARETGAWALQVDAALSQDNVFRYPFCDYCKYRILDTGGDSAWTAPYG